MMMMMMVMVMVMVVMGGFALALHASLCNIGLTAFRFQHFLEKRYETYKN